MYLLAPEVSALLHYVPTLNRRMLLSTLWNTGARINEALALMRADFNLASPSPFVQLAALKQRTKKSRPDGRPCAGQQHESQDSSPVRQSLCQSDGDHGGHAEAEK